MKRVRLQTAQRKLVLRAEAVVTLTSKALTAVAGGDARGIGGNSPLSGCTEPPAEPGA